MTNKVADVADAVKAAHVKEKRAWSNPIEFLMTCIGRLVDFYYYEILKFYQLN